MLVYLIVGQDLAKLPLNKKTKGFLKALLFDPDTNTYSLAKLQFYLWTGAAILGYAFLTAAKSLIQGNFTFAEVPDNLPGILMVSAGTTAVGTAAESFRQSKGSGEIGPSFSDLITSGGVVVAERFQFFVWTIVGCITFLGLVLLRDPASISDLPSIPSSFLALMGVSSAGYLGGKLARSPGPRIAQIAPSIDQIPPSGRLTLEIHGQNLAPDASLKIGDTDIGPNRFDRTQNPNGTPVVVVKDDTPGLAKVLLVAISDPDAAWLTGDQTLTLTNPNGQRAVWTFNAAQPAITGMTPSSLPVQPGQVQSIAVTGTNLSGNLKAELTTTDGAPTGVGLQVVSNATATACTVTGHLDVVGNYKLTLRNPDTGAAASWPIVVQPAVVQPAVVQPAVVQPAVVQPAVVQPAVVQPPVISTVTPAPIPRGVPVELTFGGSGFGPGASVQITDPVGVSLPLAIQGTPTATSVAVNVTLAVAGPHSATITSQGAASAPFQVL